MDALEMVTVDLTRLPRNKILKMSNASLRTKKLKMSTLICGTESVPEQDF